MRKLSGLLFLFAFLYSSVCFSSDEEYSKYIRMEQAEELKKLPAPNPVNEKEFLDANSLCKYAGSRKATITTSAMPDRFFKGVKGIYLVGSILSGARELNVSFFERLKISQLAACILERYLDTLTNYDTGGISAIPIYIPSRDGIPLDLWPEANEKGNIIIWADISLRNGEAWLGDPGSKIMMLKVTYARSDLTPIEQINMHCVNPIPYTEDEDKLLKSVSLAMKTCLTHKYEIPAEKKR